MNYYELLFITHPTEDYQQDLLIDMLAGIGFDTFEEVEGGFKAYIPEGDFNKELLEENLASYHEMFSFSYEVNVIRQKNWNEVWESNFEPIQIWDKVYVRATFHQSKPEFPLEIVIDPKMAFGTGHHETTSMMMDLMLDVDFAGKKVLDMGCGTGILAILASKLGAKDITAIDYDPVCYDSTIENSTLNHIGNIKAICGSKEVIPDVQYEIILANINRNILLQFMPDMRGLLRPGGQLLLSGIMTQDEKIILESAAKAGLQRLQQLEKDNWLAIRLVAE